MTFPSHTSRKRPVTIFMNFMYFLGDVVPFWGCIFRNNIKK